jgi:hypothetical protein
MYLIAIFAKYIYLAKIEEKEFPSPILLLPVLTSETKARSRL